jgi:hypothetical protein
LLKKQKNKQGEVMVDEQTFEDQNRDLELRKRDREIDDADKARDAQRGMAWFALFGMLLYPIFIVGATYLSLPAAVTTLGGIAPTYFMSVAAIVAAFYGKEAFEKTKGKK